MTSGYFIFACSNLVTWRSKQQKVVALSSIEAEFKGMAKCVCKLLWLKRLMANFGFAPNSKMNLFCNNKVIINISHNPVQHDCTKHIEIGPHFIKQNLEDNVIWLPFVKIEDQLADLLTKTVRTRSFHNSLGKLDMWDIYAPTWQGVCRYCI